MYLGKSYGTFLGAIYADTFPDRVGRMVLDGAMAPTLTDKELSLGQAEGFETALRSYLADCVSKGDCPMGGSVDAGAKGVADLMRTLDARPIPVTGDARVNQLTEGWGSMGVASAMYDQERWPELTRRVAVGQGRRRDGPVRAGESYAERSDGRYTDNIMQVISAVNCLDHPVGQAVRRAAAAAGRQEFTKEGADLGPVHGGQLVHLPQLAGAADRCSPKLSPPKAPPPIVVVGTTRDPATPYEWAQQLARPARRRGG